MRPIVKMKIGGTPPRALDAQSSGYEVPRVEAILSEEQIQREMLFAGTNVISR